MKTLDKLNFKNATCICMQTLVGVIPRQFPLESGNCFSVQCDNTSYYKIVNFVLENLKELLKQETIKWPVKILPISDKLAVIVDERIPEDWYSKEYCEVCCRFDFLPHDQQMRYVRKLLRGEIEEVEVNDNLMLIKHYDIKKK